MHELCATDGGWHREMGKKEKKQHSLQKTKIKWPQSYTHTKRWVNLLERVSSLPASSPPPPPLHVTNETDGTRHELERAHWVRDARDVRLINKIRRRNNHARARTHFFRVVVFFLSPRLLYTKWPIIYVYKSCNKMLKCISFGRPSSLFCFRFGLFFCFSLCSEQQTIWSWVPATAA